MIKSTSAAQSASLAALADRIKAIEHVLANLQDSQSKVEINDVVTKNKYLLCLSIHSFRYRFRLSSCSRKN